MAQVERSNPAEQDLISIAQYIARDNPIAAARWLDEIEQKFALLASQPFMGEVVGYHLRPQLRRISHGNYVIFYEPRANGVALIRILHGARKIEDLV